VYGLERQLCCSQNQGQFVPDADETRCLGHVGTTSGNCYIVASIAQIPHESVPLADNLRTGQRLEATHTARAPCEMLVVALDALLLHLAGDVLDLRQHHSEGWRVDRGFVGRRAVGL